MNDMSVFLLCFAFGLIVSLLGGVILHLLSRNRGLGSVQFGFFIRLILDFLAFLVVYLIYRTIPAYLGVALGLVSYKNILAFYAIKKSWQEKGRE